MKSLNYWNQFLTTGSVKDYMHYREEEQSECDGKHECMGEELDAGSGQGYRYHTEDGTYRGI